jgi:hypothetical protein
MLPSSRTNIPAERPSALSFDAARESRGDILSQWEPANSVPAEGDLLTAIAIAGQTLPIDRPRRLRRARTALKGFPPMHKFPEIEEVLEMIAAIQAGPTFVTSPSTMPFQMAGIRQLRCPPSRFPMNGSRRLRAATSRDSVRLQLLQP